LRSTSDDESIVAMGVTLEHVAEQIADLSKQLSETKVHLKNEARINMEELKAEVKLGAEGYGATLQKIERELVDLNKKVDTKFGDHDFVLADHNTRISNRTALDNLPYFPST
jgi:septation ring formation regulator EzrA